MFPVSSLVCTRCGERFDPGSIEYVCPNHDGVTGVLDVRYDESRLTTGLDQVRTGQVDGGSQMGDNHDHNHDHSYNHNQNHNQPPDRKSPAAAAQRLTTVDSLWRYEPLLPVASDEPVALGAGATPLLAAPSLGDELGIDLGIKDETGNPTGSNKDRGNAVVTTIARERGQEVVTCASTGNAAASLAAYAARAGLDCAIFVPSDCPEAKRVQPMATGATVFAVDGSYADAADCCRAVARSRGWYDCSAAVNPYGVEGKRTLGFELAEQTGGDVPDWVVLPVGNGCSLAAVWKGFRTFERLGVVDSTPAMLGVQASATAPVYDAVHDESVTGDAVHDASATGDVVHDESATGESEDGTTADSIDVSEPHNGRKARQAIEESDGAIVAVEDDAILAAQQRLGATEGLFVEPASAAAIAGIERARSEGIVDAGERVVAVGTGSGLKDTASVSDAIDDPVRVDGDPESVPSRDAWE